MGKSQSSLGLKELTAGQIVSALRVAEPAEVSVLVTELILRFEPLTAQVWWRLGGAGEEYADFRQRVWLKLLEKLPSLRVANAFAGFFKQLVVNLAYDELRKNSASANVSVPLDQDEPETEFASGLGGDIENAILVRSFLEVLPPRERQVVELECLAGFSPAEVANILGIGVGSVRMTKSRAISRLRDFVQVDSGIRADKN